MVAVLTFCKVPGKILSTVIGDQSTEVQSVGPVLFVDAIDGARVNNANAVHTDIETSNGVIYVIYQVVILA